MKTYRVGTFVSMDERGRYNYSAYTLWFNESWPSCVVYEVEAASGKEAKRMAIKMRRSKIENEAPEATKP